MTVILKKMKNTIIILFLFCFSVAYSEIHPVRMTLHEKYYENWIGTQIIHISEKYYDAVVQNTVNIYADSQCKVLLNHDQALKVMLYNQKNRDRFLYDYYTNKFVCVQKRNELYAIGIYIFDFAFHSGTLNRVITKEPVIYTKWNDLKSKLDAEENFALKIIFKYKYHNNRANNIIESSDAKALSLNMHWRIESKLFKNVVNLNLPVYTSDSLLRKSSRTDIDWYLSDEKIITLADDESNPYGPSHDSIIKIYTVRNDIDNDTGRGWDMYLLWSAQNGTIIKLIALAPIVYKTVNGVFIGNLAVGFAKMSDLSKIYDSEETQLLDYVTVKK